MSPPLSGIRVGNSTVQMPTEILRMDQARVDYLKSNDIRRSMRRRDRFIFRAAALGLSLVLTLSSAAARDLKATSAVWKRRGSRSCA